DTVYVTTAAPTVLGMLDTLMKTDTLKCTNKVFPVPIPIPIPGTDHHGGLGVASTAPEPGTAWLVGVGLVALGFVWGRGRGDSRAERRTAARAPVMQPLYLFSAQRDERIDPRYTTGGPPTRRDCHERENRGGAEVGSRIEWRNAEQKDP